MLTAITEITRNGAKSARGLVSVQSRLNQIVDESSSTGKALTEWYTKHNIAIYDQAGQLRSLYDVMQDVAKIWPTLTTNEKDYYLNQQAGNLCPKSRRICGEWLRALATWEGNDRPIVTTLRIA